MAIIKPKVRGFICITAHPEGCEANVNEQIQYVKSQGPIQNGPKNVLVIGSSTGYGLASRITAAFGSNANTYGVFFERPSAKGKPASAGWYNSVAFENAAINAGLYTKSFNGDAFSDEAKSQVISDIKNNMGPIDMIVYSLAAPRMTDPITGQTHKSTLKPIGASFKGKTIDTDKKEIQDVEIEPATDEDIQGTLKVMGGEDWERWITALNDAELLADGVTTVAYSYLGPEVTWPIYKNGTIGQAKEHLDQTAQNLSQLLKPLNGRAFVSVNKGLVTQASSAIPVVPLYISILYKVMKELGTHEGCIEQIYRMFSQRLYNNANLELDSQGRIRIDDWEMRDEVQNKIKEIWPKIETNNIDELSDFSGYQEDFLKLFGFGRSDIDYDKDVNPEIDLPSPAKV